MEKGQLLALNGAIAASAFPNRPLISVALVVGPLIELPILALVSQILLKQQDKA